MVASTRRVTQAKGVSLSRSNPSRSEESFKQYFSEMPWLAVPYSDEGRRSRLNRLYGIQGMMDFYYMIFKRHPKSPSFLMQNPADAVTDEWV